MRQSAVVQLATKNVVERTAKYAPPFHIRAKAAKEKAPVVLSVTLKVSTSTVGASMKTPRKITPGTASQIGSNRPSRLTAERGSSTMYSARVVIWEALDYVQARHQRLPLISNHSWNRSDSET